MREIKFRYVLKNKETWKISFDYLPLWRIEEWLWDRFDWFEIIDKNCFSWLEDKSWTPIYEWDYFQYMSKKYRWYWKVEFKDWMFCTIVMAKDMTDRFVPLFDFIKKYWVEITWNIYEWPFTS